MRHRWGSTVGACPIFGSNDPKSLFLLMLAYAPSWSGLAAIMGPNFLSNQSTIFCRTYQWGDNSWMLRYSNRVERNAAYVNNRRDRYLLNRAALALRSNEMRRFCNLTRIQPWRNGLESITLWAETLSINTRIVFRRLLRKVSLKHHCICQRSAFNIRRFYLYILLDVSDLQSYFFNTQLSFFNWIFFVKYFT